jgi:hypothetical protein
MKISTIAAVALAGMSVSSAMAGLGDSLYAAGGQVTVEILPSSAGYTSQLWLFEPGEGMFIATNRDTGSVVNLGSFAAGTEMVFRLFVLDTETSYFTGAASRNPDQIFHANINPESPTTAIVGFEDLYGGGDFDYDDCTFRFTGVSVPTPGPIALAGLGGLLIARRRRA